VANSIDFDVWAGSKEMGLRQKAAENAHRQAQTGVAKLVFILGAGAWSVIHGLQNRARPREATWLGCRTGPDPAKPPLLRLLQPENRSSDLRIDPDGRTEPRLCDADVKAAAH
jgi:hypothetical protein